GAGDDEAAFRTERIERRICHGVAEFSFRLAERTGAKVFGGPKWTVSPTYEGMLKEELDAAAARHPGVVYQPQLIDATFALLLAAALLAYADGTEQAGQAIREACLEAVADGIRTADLGGHAGSTEYADEVIRRVRAKLR